MRALLRIRHGLRHTAEELVELYGSAEIHRLQQIVLRLVIAIPIPGAVNGFLVGSVSPLDMSGP